ncbi:MAG: ABC transporter permease, partial [Oscillospiraceae bacterium]
MGIWDFSAIPKYFFDFFPAAVATIVIAFAGILIGIILGLLFAFLRISKYKAVNFPARAYIWLIRG